MVSSASCSHTPSVYIPHLALETKFPRVRNNRKNYDFMYFNC
jgi:hypothetical protein